MPKIKSNPFEEIIEAAICAAEKEKCSRAKFREGLKLMRDIIQDRLDLEPMDNKDT